MFWIMWLQQRFRNYYKKLPDNGADPKSFELSKWDFNLVQNGQPKLKGNDSMFVLALRVCLIPIPFVQTRCVHHLCRFVLNGVCFVLCEYFRYYDHGTCTCRALTGWFLIKIAKRRLLHSILFCLKSLQKATRCSHFFYLNYERNMNAGILQQRIPYRTRWDVALTFWFWNCYLGMSFATLFFRCSRKNMFQMAAQFSTDPQLELRYMKPRLNFQKSRT